MALMNAVVFVSGAIAKFMPQSTQRLRCRVRIAINHIEQRRHGIVRRAITVQQVAQGGYREARAGGKLGLGKPPRHIR
jgi:hypothetical protein